MAPIASKEDEGEQRAMKMLLLMLVAAAAAAAADDGRAEQIKMVIAPNDLS